MEVPDVVMQQSASARKQSDSRIISIHQHIQIGSLFTARITLYNCRRTTQPNCECPTPHLLKILRVSMISLKAKKFSMRQVKQTLRPRAAGPALRSGGGGGAGGPACW